MAFFQKAAFFYKKNQKKTPAMVGYMLLCAFYHFGGSQTTYDDPRCLPALEKKIEKNIFPGAGRAENGQVLLAQNVTEF